MNLPQLESFCEIKTLSSYLSKHRFVKKKPKKNKKTQHFLIPALFVRAYVTVGCMFKSIHLYQSKSVDLPTTSPSKKRTKSLT